MRRLSKDKRGQFVIIVALIIAALTLATALSIHQATIHRQSIAYKPADEFLLGTTSDMNRALTVALSKYTYQTINDLPDSETTASDFVNTWRASTLLSYSSYGIRIRTDLSQNMIPHFQTNWVTNGISSSYAYMPYAFDVESYGFIGWTGTSTKYIQLQIKSVEVENWPTGTANIVFQLMQSDISINNPNPISNLPNNPAQDTFRIGTYNADTGAKDEPWPQPIIT